MIWGILFVAVLLATLARVVLREEREPSSRLAWIVCIFALPVLGIVLYFLFGEVNFGRGKVVQLRAILDGLRKEPPDAPPSPELPLPVRAAFARAASVNGQRPLGGNTAELATDSVDAVDRIVADIDAAQDHVHILFYIWLEDGAGTRVLDAVRRAAERGVTCRVMIDALGSRKLARSRIWQDLPKAGVKTGLAFDFRFALVHMFFGRVDIRNHRKIVVIDHEITYVGSQNCADPEFSPKAAYGPWVDIMVRMTGPIAWQKQWLFVSDWMIHTGEDISAMLERPVRPVADGPVTAIAMGTGPTKSFNAVPDVIGLMLAAAQDRLMITTPYYVPSDALQQEICAAALRGVDVTMILPKRNDSTVVGLASRSYYRRLLRAGVKLYEYPHGLLHAKILTVDGESVLFGSANLDRRSFDLNFENSVLAVDPGLTGALDDRQREYIAASDPVSADEVEAWSPQRRIVQNLVATMGPLL